MPRMSLALALSTRGIRPTTMRSCIMNASPRAVLLALTFAAITACGGRQVEVRTAPPVGREQAVQVTNNLSQAVNVYVTPAGGQELFLRQVPANTVEKVPVQGVANGTM